MHYAAVVAIGALAVGLAAWPAPARADDQTCSILIVDFQVAADDLQLALWLEEPAGGFVRTLYVTRAVGTFGIGNRPGAFDLKSGFRWPYGRRVNALPVWAHRQPERYPTVVFADGREASVAYHESESTLEGYFCRPTTKTELFCYKPGDDEACVDVTYPKTSSHGPAPAPMPAGLTVDAVTCPTPGGGTLGKGRLDYSQSSLYPPRSDLTVFRPPKDDASVQDFAALNVVDAVSQATPTSAQQLSLRFPLLDVPDGEYVLFLEANREFDQNPFHDYPPLPDLQPEWDHFGTAQLGQPSVVYSVPVVLENGRIHRAQSEAYVGYGAWNGADGDLRPPDETITTDRAGSGAGRLAAQQGPEGDFRLRVTTENGRRDVIAPRLDAFSVARASPGTVTLEVTTPDEGEGIAVDYEIRYRAGEPVTEANFDGSQPVPRDRLGAPGETVKVVVGGLRPETHYFFAVRSLGPCGQTSPLSFVEAHTPKTPYTTIQGCFVATAAHGSEHEPAVETLRRFRDRLLLPSPAGRRLVALYYALGPHLARTIAGDDDLRRAARSLLVPVWSTARLFGVDRSIR